MLNSIKKLSGCRILAVDGEAGRVRDVYLDDDQWVVRYLVVDTSDCVRFRFSLSAVMYLSIESISRSNLLRLLEPQSTSMLSR